MVETLVDLEIPYVAGIIGSSVEDVLDALYGNSKIRYISVRHEQVASSMCDGYARVTGLPMACIAHAGPGACNLLPGVAAAYRDSSPMLIITGNMGTSRIGRDAWHELDTLSLLKPVTKWNTRVMRTADVRKELCRAYSIAIDGRPGPVHIDIPLDVSASEILTTPKGTRVARTAYRHGRPMVSADTINEVADLLLNTNKVLILAGGGVFWSGGYGALAKVAKSLSSPVVTTETSRGVLPEDDPLCLGMLGFFGNPGSNNAVREADLILGVGCRFSETSTLGWSLIPTNTSIIQVDISPKEIGRQYPVDIGIVADADEFLRGLLERLRTVGKIEGYKKEKRVSWISELQALRSADRQAFFKSAGEQVPIKPQRFVKEVAEVAGRDSIFTVGQGDLLAFTSRIPVFHPGSYLQNAGLGMMGFAFPAALGAKLAAPERPVFCLVGDGDFAMVMQDLDTAIRESLNVVVIVSDNCSYGTNKLNQLARGGRLIGVDFINPDFAELARMYGGLGMRVERPSELRPALEELINGKKAGLLDVVIDGSERGLPNPKAVGLYK